MSVFFDVVGSDSSGFKCVWFSQGFCPQAPLIESDYHSHIIVGQCCLGFTHSTSDQTQLNKVQF